MTRELHLFIKGRVQGVSYRANAAAMAHRLGLCGWVRNLPDGRVELLAQGDEQVLRRLLTWAHQGPATARVDHMDVHWGEAERLAAGFEVIP